MSYPINYPTPQGANVQIFNTGNLDVNPALSFDWVKPQGASFVWFTLIGAGGNGQGATGGGSGAVTNFMCPAFLIPDVLRISFNANDNSQVLYQTKNNTYVLLTANWGSSSTGGAAMTANYFTAMGFFQSIAGQNGATGAVSASATTFLSGGGSTAGITANYGYTVGNSAGLFQMQPIIVGVGGAGANRGGIGCGGGTTLAAPGGGPLAVIITW